MSPLPPPPRVARAIAGSSHIAHRVAIGAAPAVVFAFVTNAARWRLWHPATHAVRDVPDRPLGAGETILEEIAAAHRRFEARWTVTACMPPSWWEIRTHTPLGASVLTYRLADDGQGGTLFERTCEFRSEGAWRLLDGTLTRWMLARQARRALANLKGLLEPPKRKVPTVR